MAKQDYYEVLGISRQATPEEIKSAYRKAALKFHPDRNPGDKDAEESFKIAAEAYAVLSDPRKRERYDRFGHEGLGGASVSDIDASVFSDFADILGDFFGFSDMFGHPARRRRGPQRGPDVALEMELTLEESVFGKEAELDLVRQEACGKCGGSGAATPADVVTCPTCRGTGQQAFQQGFLTIARTCGTCRGAGRTVRRPCTECRGAGRIRRERKVTVRIPSG